MKIGFKLALIFTILTALVLAIVGIYIYYYSVEYIQKDFINHLKSRVVNVAHFHLKEDEVTHDTYQKIRFKYLHTTLLDEYEYIRKLDESHHIQVNDSLRQKLDNDFFEILKTKGHAEYHKNHHYSAGIIYPDNQGDYLVIISAFDEFGRNEIRNLKNLLIFGFFPCVTLVFILGIIFSHQALKPINRIIQKVNTITASNLYQRVPVGKSKDEIYELSVTFNNMLNRLSSSFDAQNNFISHASHELKNPLTAILGEIEITLNKKRSYEEYIKAMNIIAMEASRLEKLTLNLLQLAQTGFDTQKIEEEPVRIDELLFEIKHDIDEVNPSNQVQLFFENIDNDSDQSVCISGNYN